MSNVGPRRKVERMADDNPRIARNSKCPCGSGRKYKRCHGLPSEAIIEYTPNHIPLGTRIVNVVLSAFLLIYGAYGVWVNDLYVAGKRGNGVHLHGAAAEIMYCAMICAALNLGSVVVDHYDQSNNETDYRLFAKATQILGWVFFGIAFLRYLGIPEE